MAMVLPSYQPNEYTTMEEVIERRTGNVMSMLDFGTNYQVILLALFVAALVMGISTFSYLHNKKQIDFYHSLPGKAGVVVCRPYWHRDFDSGRDIPDIRGALPGGGRGKRRQRCRRASGGSPRVFQPYAVLQLNLHYCGFGGDHDRNQAGSCPGKRGIFRLLPDALRIGGVILLYFF